MRLAGARTPGSLDASYSLSSARHKSHTSSVDLLGWQGGHNAATESLLPGGISLSNSSHPSVLASQVAWITGESQFSLNSRSTQVIRAKIGN